MSRVEVPSDLALEVEAFTSATNTTIDSKAIATTPLSNLEHILQRTIRTKRTKDTTEQWETIIDKEKLEKAILLYCHQHFQQARQTPFGKGPLANAIGKDGLTELSDRILQGTFFERTDYELFPEIRTFIKQLAMPDIIKSQDQINSAISVDHYRKAIRNWKESTSTSPSGRHLGMYKALLSNQQITSDMCNMLNVVTQFGIIPSRWCQAISVLIEKDPGAPIINRLRVIHIFEADYNLFLKTLWARRLVTRGEESNLFGESQQGSRKGRTANDAVLLKRLTYDLSRLLRSNLGTFDNDAKSCYDRVINGLAMLAARRLGMPDAAIRTHAGVLSSMRYLIKTSYGVSELFIQSIMDAVLFGTGQGSGASPAVWLTLSVVLLNSLRQLAPKGMLFYNPGQTISVERHSDAFVDDAQNGLNDIGEEQPWDLQTLQSNLQQMSQTWERLPFSSGGALELSKCFYYLMHWHWENGLPQLTKLSSMNLPPIMLTSGSNTEKVPFSQRDVGDAHKTLGVYMTPTGDESSQVKALLEKSCKLSNAVLSSNLSKLETQIAYRTIWYPAISYSMGTTTMSSPQLRSIQLLATQSFLAKMGINRNFPRAVTYGPLEYGGLSFPDLSVEQGISQIRLCMEHLYHNTELGKLIQIGIQTLQAEAGSGICLLQDPTVALTYLPQCWLTSMRLFMAKFQLSLQLSSNWNFFISREHDKYLMDIFRQSGMFSSQDFIHLNAVRLFLQVATVADLATADEGSVNEDYYHGRQCPLRKSRLTWPRHPTIIQYQKDLWTKAIRLTLLVTLTTSSKGPGNSKRLKIPLGAWISKKNQTWERNYDPLRDCLIMQLVGTSRHIHNATGNTRRSRRLSKSFTVESEFSTDISLTSCAVPAEVHLSDSRDFVLASYSQVRRSQQDNSSPLTCQEYIKRLPAVRRRLLSWSKPMDTLTIHQSQQLLRQAIAKGKQLYTTTDGGLQECLGSFGCVIADSTRPLWVGAGPVDMDPATANSSRPEMAGYAGLWETLLMFSKVYPDLFQDTPLEITTWVDSTSALRRLRFLQHEQSLTRAYPADADLQSHIKWLWSQTPHLIPKLAWVKAHQDDRILYTKLSHPAKLNVLANQLATDYLTKSQVRPRSNPWSMDKE